MRTRLYQRVSDGADDPGLNERRFLGALNEDMQEMDRRINQALKYQTKIITTTLNNSGVEIRHGMGRVPRFIWVSPKDDVRWWEYKERTRDSVFLKASGTADAEVRIEG